jgi:hypothetical protein
VEGLLLNKPGMLQKAGHALPTPCHAALRNHASTCPFLFGVSTARKGTDCCLWCCTAGDGQTREQLPPSSRPNNTKHLGGCCSCYNLLSFEHTNIIRLLVAEQQSIYTVEVLEGDLLLDAELCVHGSVCLLLILPAWTVPQHAATAANAGPVIATSNKRQIQSI